MAKLTIETRQKNLHKKWEGKFVFTFPDVYKGWMKIPAACNKHGNYSRTYREHMVNGCPQCAQLDVIRAIRNGAEPTTLIVNEGPLFKDEDPLNSALGWVFSGSDARAMAADVGLSLIALNKEFTVKYGFAPSKRRSPEARCADNAARQGC